MPELNPNQTEAVFYGDGPLLIVAGAGTGKTRVLTHRIAHLIQRGVPSFQILAVTFTNKAATEMRERVRKLVAQEVWVSTFHATGLKILRLEGNRIGIPRNFLVFDDYDQLVLIKECLIELGFNEKHFNPKGLRESLSRAKDDLKGPEDIQANAHDNWEDILAKVYELYEKKLARIGALDFGDLIFKTVRLFRENPDILETYQDRFRYILIDEYQDTNRAQYHLIKLLASKHRNLTVVGDPDQSIYAWRGADIRNILDFEKDYENSKHVTLDENYRSTTKILDAANHLIDRNFGRKPKRLWSRHGEGEPLYLYEARDEKDEANFVVQEILELKAKGHSPKEMVVFYRTHAQSRVFEDVLRRYQVSYRIVGGVRFYDRREIKDLLAYLRILVNPQDDVSCKRIINVPARGLGKKALEKIENYAQEKQVSFFKALQNVKQIPGLTPKAALSIEKFLKLHKGLAAKRFEILTSELIPEVLDRTGILGELQTENTIESKGRIENLKEFISVVFDFEANPVLEDVQFTDEPSPKTDSLSLFLESITLETDLDQWSPEEESLTLMTFHTAKGLEFPFVFMVGMEEEIFPHANSMTSNREDMEEERRLCYVGITRGQKRVTLSFASSRMLYGFRDSKPPSRFINEIPSHLLKYLGPGLSHKESFDDDILFVPDDEFKDKRRKPHDVDVFEF
jgi:DNA helicase-2/ATP-dependent DNA helicase PcrA